MSELRHSSHHHAHPPRKWERIATLLSAACAVHCVALPAVTAALPALGATEIVHAGSSLDVVLSVFVVVSVTAGAVWGFRRHRDVRVAVAMVIGLVAYLLGHALHESPSGTAISVAGALILAAASFASTRLGHHCEHAH